MCPANHFAKARKQRIVCHLHNNRPQKRNCHEAFLHNASVSHNNFLVIFSLVPINIEFADRTVLLAIISQEFLIIKVICIN